MAVPPETTNAVSSAPSSSNAGNKQPTSSHRLPTVSASEAFRNLSDDDNHPPSNAYTEIAELDDALGGGFESGKVTELWGPPGAGKTAIALKATISVLQKDSSVVWIDTTHPLSATRALTTLPPTTLTNFHQTHTPTLSHLLTLLQHPPPTFPPPSTRLLVLTNLHALLEISNPRNPAPASSSTAAGTTGAGSISSGEAHKWAAARRYALLGTLASLLNQVAARHGLAVVVTTGCATRMMGGGNFGGVGGAGSNRLGLVPGVGGREWESGVWARAGVVRDFGGRVVGVSKARGGAVADDDAGWGEATGLGRVVGFEIADGGVAVARRVRAEDGGGGGGGLLDGGSVEGKVVLTSPVRGRKRALEEIADSDDDEEADEYGGWAGLDEEDALGRVNGNEADGEEDGQEGEVAASAAANATIVIDD